MWSISVPLSVISCTGYLFEAIRYRRSPSPVPNVFPNPFRTAERRLLYRILSQRHFVPSIAVHIRDDAGKVPGAQKTYACTQGFAHDPETWFFTDKAQRSSESHGVPRRKGGRKTKMSGKTGSSTEKSGRKTKMSGKTGSSTEKSGRKAKMSGETGCSTEERRQENENVRE